MQCPLEHGKHQSVLLDFCAGRLSREQHAAAEQHISECTRCRCFVDDQRSLWTALDSFEPPAVSDNFDRRLYARIERESQLSWWARQWIRAEGFLQSVRLAPVMAAVGLVLVAYLAITPDRPPLPQDQDPRSQSPVGLVDARQTVELEQVERALEDLEMLDQLDPKPASGGTVRLGPWRMKARPLGA